MATMPCTNAIGNCPGSDFPISNYSAEGAEQVPTFTSLKFPESWDKPGCLSVCISEISQEDANLCALAQESACPPPFVLPPDVGGDGDDPSFPPPSRFLNDEQSCTADCPDGNGHTFTTPAGTFADNTQTAANARAEAYACQKAQDTLICIGNLENPSLCSGVGYLETVQITIPSGDVPIMVSLVEGSLPEGITLDYDDSSFTLIGTTDAPGQYDFRVRVEDFTGDFTEKDFSLFVVGISPETLPDATVGTTYSQQLTTLGPTVGIVTWSISGSLPAGLTLNSSTGFITGTPTTAGTSSFQAVFEDQR